MALARGKQADGADAEIAQDLRAEADFAPLVLARFRRRLGLVALAAADLARRRRRPRGDRR